MKLLGDSGFFHGFVSHFNFNGLGAARAAPSPPPGSALPPLSSGVPGTSSGTAAPPGSSQTNRAASSDDPHSHSLFVCERVCASNKLIKRLGWISKDPSVGACMTVCADNEQEACTEACAQVMCADSHEVPAWNDACVKRCTAECTKFRTHER
ncbi:GTPase [Pycnococcus provasolii]